MVNVEAFQNLCRKAATEKDPGALERFQEELRLMLLAEEIEWRALEKRPGLKSN